MPEEIKKPDPRDIVETPAEELEKKGWTPDMIKEYKGLKEEDREYKRLRDARDWKGAGDIEKTRQDRYEHGMKEHYGENWREVDKKNKEKWKKEIEQTKKEADYKSPSPSATEVKKPQAVPPVKRGGKWFKKIPRDVLFSPGGIVLIFFAILMETIDLIPVPVLDNLWELPMEIIFGAMLITIAKVPVLSLAIPFIIERIPLINDIVPSYLIRMFM